MYTNYNLQGQKRAQVTRKVFSGNDKMRSDIT